MWTSAANKGPTVVTLHWISEDWLIQTVMVGFTRVEYPHTGARLAYHLVDTLRAMHGSLFSKLWAITTDNASNNGTMIETINAALQDQIDTYARQTVPPSNFDAISTPSSDVPSEPRVKQVRCLAHVLQLAVKEGLKQCPLMDDSIGVIRDFLKKLSDSPSLLEALQEVCTSVNVKFIAPELDCVTRWNSTLTMLASAHSLKVAIVGLQRRIRGRHEGYKDFSIGPDDRLAAPFSETTWGYVVELMTFLRPIKGATTMMSGKNYSTFGVALVVYHLVTKHASKTAANAVFWYMKDFARAFKTKLDEYIPVVKTKHAQIAAVLDPRAKSHLSDIGIDVESVRRLVEAEFESVYKGSYDQIELVATSAEKTQKQIEEAEDAEALYCLIDEHMESGTLVNSTSESFATELARWLEHPDRSMTLKTTSRAVCNWMKHETASFPRIRMMARDYLSVMATSVPSEEAFSASGTTISSRRARLGDDAVTTISELQAFLAFNMTSGDAHAGPVAISKLV